MITEPTTNPNDTQPDALPPVLLREIGLRNLLSFGPDTPNLPLQSLNVLIGPNGSGKSNLIEAISLLRASAGDMQAVVRKGGGVGEWIWKGAPDQTATIAAVIDGFTNKRTSNGQNSLRHMVEYKNQSQRLSVCNEYVDVLNPNAAKDTPLLFLNEYLEPIAIGDDGIDVELESIFDESRSVIGQLADPFHFPAFAYLQRRYESIKIYRDWTFGRNSVTRQPQQADERSDRLNEDFSNLGLFLNYLRRNAPVKRKI